MISEAVALGAKEALKLLLIWLLWAGYLHASPRRGELLGWVMAGLTAAFVICAGLTFTGQWATVKPVMTRLVGYVFFLFFLSSTVALFMPDFKRLGDVAASFAGPGLALIMLIFVIPDTLGATIFIADLSVMKGGVAGAYGSFALGFSLPFAVLALRPARLAGRLSGYIDAGQLLLLLAMIKLVVGGIRGLSEFSLIPTVQRGVMKFTHDLIHQTFVFLLVPDHPVLTLTTWKFIGVLFGPNFGLAVTISLLLGPALVYVYELVAARVAGVEEAHSGAQRRLLRAEARRLRFKKAISALVFVGVVIAFWVSASTSGEVSAVYNPAPKPVIDDKGVIALPLTDPTMDLRDGSIHKFAVLRNGKEVRFFVMKRPDGKLSACLDACEICPPEGYGQNADFVVCLFCRTPISTATLGKSGGCNPIPLKAEISESQVRISVSELDLRWSDVQSGKPKGGMEQR